MSCFNKGKYEQSFSTQTSDYLIARTASITTIEIR